MLSFSLLRSAIRRPRGDRVPHVGKEDRIRFARNVRSLFEINVCTIGRRTLPYLGLVLLHGSRADCRE